MRIDKDQIKALAAIVVMVGVYCVAIGMPSSKKRKALAEELKQVEAQVQSDRTIASALPDIGRTVVSLEEQVASEPKYLPDEEERSRILKYLSTHLERQAVSDQEIRTRPFIMGADYNVTPVTIGFEGSFVSAFNFVRDVEAMQQLVRISRVEIAGKRGKLTNDLSVRLDLDTFYLPVDGEGEEQ